MKVLVTGADGYIGSLLAPLLMTRGHEVVGLDTGFYRSGWLYNNGISRIPAFINEDIRNITESVLQDFNAVVHMAELSNDPLGQLNQKLTFKINHLASVNIAKMCKKSGVERFIYTSSCSVYGAGTSDYRTEDSETNPQTAYAWCKVLVERDVSEMADDGFSPTFLRNATAYGPSPRMRFDVVLNNLCGLAWTIGEIQMTSDGTPWRPLVHVLDICEAIACCLESPREVVHKQIFNVGNTEDNYQVKDIAEIVAKVFPGCKVALGDNKGDNRSYRVSFDKINKTLPGFNCKRDVETGANQMRDLFKRLDMKRETFEFRPYTRLKQLEYLIRTKQLDDNLFWS